MTLCEREGSGITSRLACAIYNSAKKTAEDAYKVQTSPAVEGGHFRCSHNEGRGECLPPQRAEAINGAR